MLQEAKQNESPEKIERKGVFLFFSTVRCFEHFDNEKYASIIRAIVDYAQYGKEPEFDDPAMVGMFNFIKREDDHDDESEISRFWWKTRFLLKTLWKVR